MGVKFGRRPNKILILRSVRRARLEGWAPDWAKHFLSITDAIAVERQIKGWSRAKKEALIRGDFEQIHELAKTKLTIPLVGNSEGRCDTASPTLACEAHPSRRAPTS